MIDYQTKNSFAVFFFPELEVGIDCISFDNSTLGIQFQFNWYASGKKSINYQRTTYEWTRNNYTTDEIIGDKHKYQKTEIDFGIYMKW